jgi:hypothetical protein
MAAHPVSLFMILHKCEEYYLFCQLLTEEINHISKKYGAADMVDPEYLARIKKELEKGKTLLKSLGCKSSYVFVHLHVLLKHEFSLKDRMTAQILGRELDQLRTTIYAELTIRKFLYIPLDEDKYLRAEMLFGEEVHNAFPDARVEIKDAGTSFAAELYGACIFHLMRCAEHGLRSLARRLKVKVSHTHALIPLDYADWDAVIAGIRNEIAKVRKLPRGPKRQAQLDRYSSAADHCEYMKDIWRNAASHTRRVYIRPDAMQAMDRVKDFMLFLSTALK